MANNKDFRVKNNIFVTGLGTSTFSGDVSIGDTITVQGAATFQDEVNLNSALNASSLSLSGNATISGNLTVSGTTTWLDSTNTQIKDKNIVLNYSTGDSSANADGAGITIQDAVNSSTDATFTWNSSADRWEASNKFLTNSDFTSLGFVQSYGDFYSRSNLRVLNAAGNGWTTWATRASGTYNLSNLGTISSGAITSTGVNVTGAIQLNGTNFAFESGSGTYHQITDPTGNTALYLGGSDEGNYHNNTTHYFRNRSGTNYAFLNANGFYLSQGGYRVGTTQVITSSRNLVNIGTGSFSGKVTISTATDEMLTLSSNDDGPVYMSFERGTDRHAYFGFGSSGDVFTLMNEESAGSVRLGTAGTVALTIDSSQTATFAGDISLPDVKKIKLGTGNDLLLYHDSESVIEDAGTNGLDIRTNGPAVSISGASDLMAKFIKDGAVELYHDNVKRLQTTSSGVEMINGLVVQGATSFNDDANFGAALQLNGTTVTSTAAELNKLDGFTGTVADLNYAKDLRATGVTATEFDYLDGVTSNIQTQIDAVQTVTINNNADNRLITGSGTAQTLNGEANLLFGATGNTLEVKGSPSGSAAGTVKFVDNDHGNTFGQIYEGDGFLYFTSRNGTSNGSFRFFGQNGSATTTYGGFDASGNFEIGTTDVITSSRELTALESISLADNKELRIGTGNDLVIKHTGSHAVITNATGNIDITNNANDGDFFFKSDDGSGGVATYIQLNGGTGSVNLRHYGDVKLATISTGVDVTGGLVVDHGNWTSSDVVNVTTDQFDAGATFQTGEFLLFGDHNGSADKMLSLKRAGTDVFMVDRNGQVGIGIDSPSAKLHVEGDLKVTGDITITDTSTDPFIRFNTSEREYVVRIDNSDSDKFQIRDVTAGATRLSIDSTGLVTTVSDARVSGNLGVGRAPDASFDLDVNGTSKFRGATTHNAGIQISNTTVIDASRNLTNIGTISSGAITTTDILTVNTDNFDFGVKVAQATGTGYAPASILLEATQAGSRGQGIYHYNTVNDKNWFTGTFYNNSSNSWGVAYASQTSFNSNIAQLANAKLIVTTGGSVGVGTTAPDALFHVKHASNNVVAKFESGDNQVWINLNDDGGGTYGALLGHDSDAGHMFAVADNSVTKRFVINDSGNVGIGINSPSAKLHIEGGSVSNTAKFIIGGSDAIVKLGTGQSSFGGPHGLQFDYASGQSDGMSMYYRTTPRAISFEDSTGVSGNKVMVIEQDGNVGIATDSPSQKLHVAGNIYAASGFVNSSGYQLNGTYIVDSSRNLVNIGTYSGSGDMHLTGVGTALKFDTLGSTASNQIKTINNYETLISTNRGNAGHLVVGNSNIRMGFGTAYTVAQSDITINSTGTIDIAIPTTFAGTATFSGSLKTDLIQREGDGLSAFSFLDFDMDTGGSSGTNNVVLGGVNNVDFLIDTNNNSTTGAFVFGKDAQNMSAGTQLMTLDESGHLDLKTGNYKVNGTTVIDSSRNLQNIGTLTNSGTITSTGSDHTFYSGGSTQSLAVGRLANQSIKIEVTDNNNIIQAFQDSDSNGNHYFDLRRDFDGTGANMFRVRKGTLTQFEIDGDSNATFAGDIDLADAKKIKLGNGDDLQIYHTGSHSYIYDTGTGNLVLKGTEVVIQSGNSSESKAIFRDDGAAELYHNDSVRLTTQAAGIKVNSADVGGVAAPILNVGQLNNAYQSGMESSVHLTMKTYNPSGNFYFYKQSNILASIIDGDFCIGQVAVIDSSRNLVNIGTISSGKITANTGDASAQPLTIGSSASTNYTLQNWITTAHAGVSAYTIAYGASHSSQAGNFAMKNIASGGEIFFELAGSVEPLRMTSTGATFAGTISSGAITSSGQININGTTGLYLYAANGTTFRAAFHDDGTRTRLFADGNGSNPHMTFNGGNVGVGLTGTNHPSARLHVQGSGATVTSLVECTDGNQASLDLKNSEGHYRFITNSGQLQIYDQTDSRQPFTIDTSGTTTLKGSTADTSDHTLIVRNSSNTALFSIRNDNRIDVGGSQLLDSSRNFSNIGTITQTTNGEILDSSANLTNINNVYANGYRIGSTQIITSSRNLQNIQAITSAGTHQITSVSTSFNPFLVRYNSTYSNNNLARIRQDGAASIFNLYDSSGTAQVQFGTNTNNYLVNGNTGIGLNNPTEKFQVQGNIRASGAYKIGANKVIEQVGTRLNIGDVSNSDYIVDITAYGDTSSIVLNDGFIDVVGDFDIAGALSKNSGSFKIDHPLKPDTHHLVHSFVEGPQADNLYRGKIELVDGRAVIDLDEWFGMTPGTFLALNRDLQAFVSNEEDWDAVRAKVMGSQLVIECQNARSKASVSWLVVGERQDNEIYESTLTDDYGKIIVEPVKQVVE